MGECSTDPKHERVRDNPNKVLVTTAKSGGARKYHDDPDCKYVNHNHNIWPRSLVNSWDYDPCKNCTQK